MLVDRLIAVHWEQGLSIEEIAANHGLPADQIGHLFSQENIPDRETFLERLGQLDPVIDLEYFIEHYCGNTGRDNFRFCC